MEKLERRVAVGKNHTQFIKRPDVYFQSDGDMPEYALLQIHQPPSHANIPVNKYERMMEIELARRETQIADEMRKANQSFMVMDAVSKQSHSDRPKSREPRRKMNPRFASLNKWLRISAIKRSKQFVSDYMQAREAFRLGNGDVVFPFGTYALRVYPGVNGATG